MGEPGVGPPSKVAAQIARYLDDHPWAADNLKGVVGCWLERDPNDSAVLAATEEALEMLVRAGVVARYSLGNDVLYACSPGN
jgi:hypothetical protein